MAQINPSVPSTNDPSYLNYSKPISQPTPNRAAEVALKGIGNAVEMGLKGLDYIVQDQATKEAYAAASEERDKYVQTLESLNPSVNKPLNILKYSDEGDSDNSVKLPNELENLPTELNTLVSARANGKFSSTYYLQRLNSKAKELRTKYPGYREYIDKAFHDATGLNIANAYVTSLLGDLNAVVTASGDLRKSVINKLMSQEFIKIPGADIMIQKIQSGEMTPEQGLEFINKNTRLKWENEVRKDIIESKNLDKSVKVDEATELASNYALQLTDQYLSAVKMGTGLNTPDKIFDILRKAANGELTLTDEQARLLSAQLRARKQEFRNSMRQFLYSSEGNRTPLATTLGVDKTNKLLEDASKPFDDIMDMIINKDYGAAFAAANAVEAAVNDTSKKLMNDVNLGKYFRMLGAAKQIGGPSAPLIFQNLLTKGLQKDLTTYLDYKAHEMTTQPDIRQGVVHTPKKAIEEAQKKGIKLPQAYDAFISTVEQIKNPSISPEIKLNLLRAIGDPSNRGLISKFNVDGIDPVSGRPMPGKYTVYQRLTAPDMVKEIAKLQSSDPKAATDYINWAVSTFGQELFRREINSLNNLPDFRGFTVVWNSDTNQFAVLPKTVNPADSPFDIAAQRIRAGTIAGFNEAQRIINRLNLGLLGLSTVAKEFNMDVDAFLLSVLQESGVNFGTAGTDRAITVPEQMMNALTAARGKRLLINRMNKKPEEGGE